MSGPSEMNYDTLVHARENEDKETYKKNIETIFDYKHRLVNSIDEVVNIDEIRRLAYSKMNMNALSYYMSGSGDEQSLNRNYKIFSKILMYPRILRNVNHIDTSVTILGQKFPFPVILAPTAMQKLCHPQGEIGVLKAAKSRNVLMCLSSISSTPMMEVAKEAKGHPMWFQLYVKNDRKMTQKLVKYCEKYGFGAICVTVDAPVLGYRERDFMIKFSIPKTFNYKDITVEKGQEGTNKGAHEEQRPKTKKPNSELFSFFDSNMETTINWDFVTWLRSITKLRIVLKGVHRVDDAVKAQEMGVDGIIVSNHGGRQLDTVPSTIEMLIPIAKALKKRDPNSKMELYVDGGIRRGNDIIKALAFGAKAVLIGRSMLWGLAAGGQEGVEKVLDMLKMEMIHGMKLLGSTNLGEITEDLVLYKSKF